MVAYTTPLRCPVGLYDPLQIVCATDDTEPPTLTDPNVRVASVIFW